MTIQRLENVGIVVADLAAATTFFVELGLKLLGESRSRAVGWTVWWGSHPAHPRQPPKCNDVPRHLSTVSRDITESWRGDSNP
jgi:catechol 2,3-dioxygenase-like lactoylglutathione lyase family enzyme